jgi:hypothetical protein
LGGRRDAATFSKALIVLGLAIAAIGFALRYAPWLVNWFGRLPGDIDITRDGGRIFIPITSMIIVSVVLTIVVNLLFRK